MNILVRGAYGESNFGDDALMCVLESFFIRNGLTSQLTFTSTIDAEYCNSLLSASTYVNLVDVRMQEVDLLVYGGGTQFFTFGKKESKLARAVSRIRSMEYKDILKKIANKLNAGSGFKSEKAAVGIGLGPFKFSDERLDGYKALAREFDFMAVRDEVSYGYCQDWGVENALLGADICFSDYLDLSTINLKAPARAKKKIGVIVRDWIHEKEGSMYYTPLMNVVDAQHDQYEFVYIVFAPDRDPEWMKQLQKVKQEVVVWTPEKDTIENFTQFMAGFDGFITARYHGAVFASLLNKPTICVEIEPKLKILTQQVPEFLLWNKPFGEKELAQSLSYFEKENFDCQLSVGKLRDKSNYMFREFLAYIGKLEEKVSSPKALAK
ncbi:polysaccharide pyruvyl transferase family protein [Siphonobacter aquaeclarae]|uniref:Polysaccharide pyruvyl transferase family protein WcaK n=1 Tax=Siphonobacter aquaeclarae TaxID=563176 RepID=A0A1G9V6R6_9BACT|nr:polysaccharide pyruvyl transferase family protein [Siphonobacter aquaeclarae]SDM67851.1 Polysaccharide pyruvyl transferase family protein WcaK [Siphonobacter aquaeclarae]